MLVSHCVTTQSHSVPEQCHRQRLWPKISVIFSIFIWFHINFVALSVMFVALIVWTADGTKIATEPKGAILISFQIRFPAQWNSSNMLGCRLMLDLHCASDWHRNVIVPFNCDIFSVPQLAQKFTNCLDSCISWSILYEKYFVTRFASNR